MSLLSAYEKLSFEDAAKIISFWFQGNIRAFAGAMEELIWSPEPPYKSIAPSWYESYKQNQSDNKKSK